MSPSEMSLVRRPTLKAGMIWATKFYKPYVNYFRKFIPFQFQPNQQSWLIRDSNSPPASVPGNDDLHRCEGSILSCDRGQEVQDDGIDKLFSGSILDSRASTRLTTHRVIKTKRRQGATSVRRQLRSFAGEHCTSPGAWFGEDYSRSLLYLQCVKRP